MGCNCKGVQKLQSHLINANNKTERKGISKLLFTFFNGMRSFLLKLVISMLILILSPFVAVILLYNFLFTGEATIRLPNKIAKNMAEHSTAGSAEGNSK